MKDRKNKVQILFTDVHRTGQRYIEWRQTAGDEIMLVRVCVDQQSRAEPSIRREQHLDYDAEEVHNLLVHKHNLLVHKHKVVFSQTQPTCSQTQATCRAA